MKLRDAFLAGACALGAGCDDAKVEQHQPPQTVQSAQSVQTVQRVPSGVSSVPKTQEWKLTPGPALELCLDISDKSDVVPYVSARVLQPNKQATAYETVVWISHAVRFVLDGADVDIHCSHERQITPDDSKIDVPKLDDYLKAKYGKNFFQPLWEFTVLSVEKKDSTGHTHVTYTDNYSQDEHGHSRSGLSVHSIDGIADHVLKVDEKADKVVDSFSMGEHYIPEGPWEEWGEHEQELNQRKIAVQGEFKRLLVAAVEKVEKGEYVPLKIQDGKLAPIPKDSK